MKNGNFQTLREALQEAAWDGKGPVLQIRVHQESAEGAASGLGSLPHLFSEKKVQVEEWLFQVCNTMKYTQAQVEPAAHGRARPGSKLEFLQLNCQWLTGEFTTLIIRDFYADFYELALSRMSMLNFRGGQRIRRVLVEGTAGIGKSGTCSFCLLRMLMDGKHVILHSCAWKHGAIYFKPTKPAPGGQTEADSLTAANLGAARARVAAFAYKVEVVSVPGANALMCAASRSPGSLENWVYLVDSVAPIGEQVQACSTLMFSSPHNHDALNNFQKGAIPYVFPLWTHAELTLAADNVFNLDRKTLSMRLALFGNIPRAIFEGSLSYGKVFQRQLAKFRSMSALKLTALLSDPKGQELSNKLVHLDSPRSQLVIPFTIADHGDDFWWKLSLLCKHRLASITVVNTANRRIKIRRLEELRTLLEMLGSSPSLASGFGNLFEQCAHAILSCPASDPLILKPLKPLARGAQPPGITSPQARGRLMDLDFSLQCTTLIPLDNIGWQDQVRTAVQGKSKAERAKLYFMPKSKRFTGVDGFTGDGTLFQITVAQKHPVKLWPESDDCGGVAAVAEALSVVKLRIVFVTHILSVKKYTQAQKLTMPRVALSVNPPPGRPRLGEQGTKQRLAVLQFMCELPLHSTLCELPLDGTHAQKALLKRLQVVHKSLDDISQWGTLDEVDVED